MARAYGVSQGWISRLVARYQAEGEAAFEPRSRRPKTSLAAIPVEAAELIVVLRKDLAGQGLDAGPDTIAWHLHHHHQVKVSAATVSRHLSRAGLVTPEPRKRPKSSYLRFEAEHPNECWQSDFPFRVYSGSWPDGGVRYSRASERDRRGRQRSRTLSGAVSHGRRQRAGRSRPSAGK